jgi:hypothetical protein
MPCNERLLLGALLPKLLKLLRPLAVPFLHRLKLRRDVAPLHGPPLRREGPHLLAHEPMAPHTPHHSAAACGVDGFGQKRHFVKTAPA